jgi:hypothetical protein
VVARESGGVSRDALGQEPPVDQERLAVDRYEGAPREKVKSRGRERANLWVPKEGNEAPGQIRETRPNGVGLGGGEFPDGADRAGALCVPVNAPGRGSVAPGEHGLGEEQGRICTEALAQGRPQARGALDKGQVVELDELDSGEGPGGDEAE